MYDVKYVKLIVGARNGKSMKQLKSLPEGEKMALLWYEIMQLAGEVNERGFLYYDNDFPYTEEMLGVELGYDTKFIKYALGCLQRLNMISIIDNVYYLTNWEKYQNVESLEKLKERRKLYMREYRAKQKESSLFLPELVDKVEQDTSELPNKAQNKPMAEVFKKYGNYGWVKLKDSQIAKIKADFPKCDINKQIELLDEYIQTNGNKNKYKDWYLVLRKSIRDKWFINGSTKEVKTPEWYNDYTKDLDRKIKQSKSKYEGMSLEEVLNGFEEKK